MAVNIVPLREQAGALHHSTAVSSAFDLRCKLSGSLYQIAGELPKDAHRASAEAIVRGLNRTADAVEGALAIQDARAYLPIEVAITTRVVDASAHLAGESYVDVEGANGFGLGTAKIKLDTPPELEASMLEAVACHELVHLTLARLLDPVWGTGSAPAFCDWIVRGIESWFENDIPEVPYGTEVWRRAPIDRERELFDELDDARRYYGEALATLLFDGAFLNEPRWARQRLVECSLGRTLLKHLRARHGSAGLPDLLSARLDMIRRLERSEGTIPLDPGDLFYLPASRLDEATDLAPAVRLSMIAHALSAADNSFREGDGDARSWLERFVISRAEGARLHVSNAHRGEKTCGLSGDPRAWVLLALSKTESDVRSLVLSACERIERFEARVLWARILARLIAEAGDGEAFTNLAPAGAERPRVVVDGADAFRAWNEAAERLEASCAEKNTTLASWVPEVIAGTLDATRTPSARAPVLFVSDAELSATLLAETRAVAAMHPIAGALFSRVRGGAYERLPARLGAPRDPRYREDEWIAPDGDGDFIDSVTAATKYGRLTTPLSHLLAHMRVGFGERII